MDRRPTLSELSVERHAEQQSGEGAEEEQDDGDTAEVGAVAEQRGLDQRVVPVPPFVAQEGAHEQQTGGEEGEGPERPALGLALDEWVDDRDQREADEPDPTDVELEVGSPGAVGEGGDREDECQHADWHVDEEHEAPSDVPEVGVDQGTGDDRRGQQWQARRRPDESHRLVELALVGKDLLEEAEALRDHQRAEAALKCATDDQQGHRRGCGAGAGEQGEAGEPEQEHPAAAEDVAEPRARDQQHGKRQGVPGADPLQRRRGAAEVVPDRRASDVCDRRVHRVHHVRGHDHDEHDPPEAMASPAWAADAGR